MSNVARFGVSLKPEVLKALDDYKDKKKFANRSQAITFIVEEALAGQAHYSNREVCGALVLVYDHHKTDFMSKFVSIQHDYQSIILASQHIHVDHHNCLETITLRGKPVKLQELADMILSLKGIKHGKLVLTSL